VRVTDTVTGCDTILTKQVTTNGRHDPQLAGAWETCVYTHQYYHIDTAAGYEYTWDVTGGSVSEVETGRAQIWWEDPGAGEVRLAQHHIASGYDTVHQLAVEVHPLPEAGFTLNERPELAAIEAEPHDTTHAHYMWDFGDGTGSTDMRVFHTYTSNGNHEVGLLVENEKGCKNTSTQMTDITTVGLAEHAGVFGGLTLYPNPFHSTFEVRWSPEERSRARLLVTDVSGRVMKERTIVLGMEAGGVVTVDGSAWSRGVYIVQLVPDTGERVYVVRMMKKYGD
jgi:PKD repeat protein